MWQQMIFLCGYPAAGKSTFAKRYIQSHPEFDLISADQCRQELYGSQDHYGSPTLVYHALLQKMKASLHLGRSILYDGTNLYRAYREDFLRDLDAELTHFSVQKNLVIIPTCKEICIDRHLKRDRNIPLKNLLPYFDINEHPSYDEGWDNIWEAGAVAYVAAPFFTRADRENAVRSAEILRTKGLETYLPLEHKIENAWDLSNPEWGYAVFQNDISAINRSDVVVVLSYGRIASAGTSWEAGYAYGIGKRVIIVEMPGVNLMSLMVANGRYATIHGLDELETYDFIQMPQLRDNLTEQK